MHSFQTLRRRAFTIIELLVVISIIGLLTALAAASYVNAQKNARDNARKTNVGNIATAVETYYRANGKFPGQLVDPADPVTQPTAAQYSSWKGCFMYNSLQKQIIYYYYPSTGGLTPCGDSTRAAGNGFNPNDYQPSSTWIPGLGPYLNPLPVESRYTDPTGGTTPLDAASSGTWDAAYDILQSSNNAFTLYYDHLKGGYMVYTKLENPSSDTLNQNGTTSTTYGSTTQPKYDDGSNVVVGTTGVYMIIR